MGVQVIGHIVEIGRAVLVCWDGIGDGLIGFICRAITIIVDTIVCIVLCHISLANPTVIAIIVR